MLANTIRSIASSNPTPLAALCLPLGATRAVRLRKLSPTSMMAEAEAVPEVWTPIQVSLRNIGKVAGFVAWVDGNRFGVCFDENIDPARVDYAVN